MNLVTILSIALLSPSVCEDIQSLPKGGVAPCDGILWTLDASKKALACRKVEVPSLQQELRLNLELLEAERSAHKDITNNLMSNISEQEALISKLKEPTPWYKRGSFWVPVSFALGIASGVYLGGL